MKALLIKKDHPSSSPVLVTTEVPIPILKPGRILVKVHAAAIQPSDAINAQGLFAHTTFPRVVGRDFSGVVESGPPSLLGKKVLGTSGNSLSFTEDGTHAEYVVTLEKAVAPMAENLTFVQAATIGVPWTTASIALSRAQPKAAEIVLVIGATGAVGGAMVQLARVAGCTVFTASRRSTTDINILSDPELKTIMKLTNNHGADVVLDTVGDPDLMRAALGILAVGGRLSYIAAPNPEKFTLTFDLRTLYRKGQMIIGSNSLNFTSEEMASILKTLTPEFESGRLKATPDEEITKVGLGQEAIDAYAKVTQRLGKKIVISMSG